MLDSVQMIWVYYGTGLRGTIIVYTKEQSIEEFQLAYTFEEQLSKWILDRVLHCYELAQTMEDIELPPEIAAIKGINPRQGISLHKCSGS